MNVLIEGQSVILQDVTDFDIEQTLECGQCFHFEKLGEKEYGLTAFGKLLHIKQENSNVILYNTTISEYENIWKNYFDMDRDYNSIKKMLLAKDDKLKEAIDTMSGVRILNQEFFETLISFIISQNKQIPHIKKIVAEISRKYGHFLGEINGQAFYSFPTVDELAAVTENDLRECKTGFRAPYIVDAVIKVKNKTICKDNLYCADVQECEKMLTQIKGVGVKVANCTMLFGIGKREAFPVDVWIKRIMEYMYFDGREISKEQIAEFARNQFGIYGGYAQQYLFYYGKINKLGVNVDKAKTKGS